MTVGELRQLLAEHPDHLEVWVDHEDWGSLGEIVNVERPYAFPQFEEVFGGHVRLYLHDDYKPWES